MISSLLFLSATCILVLGAAVVMLGAAILLGTVKVRRRPRHDANHYATKALKFGVYATMIGVPLWLLGQVAFLFESMFISLVRSMA